jgi:hypothetical protein
MILPVLKAIEHKGRCEPFRTKMFRAVWVRYRAEGGILSY